MRSARTPLADRGSEAAGEGADLSIRLDPNTGPRIRDGIHARMGEEHLRIAHPAWGRLTAVGVVGA